MAFYGSLGEVNFENLDASIADTAVDVFVYDTSKDSDGGAWRKRTQHTSWYNETLNTATRGSRREFPAVAVIVGYNDSDKGLVIYDGDDPDFPMWMVFEHTSFGALNNNNPTYKTNSVAMLNGKLCAAVYNGSSTGGLAIIDFLEDSCYRSHQSGGTYTGYYFRGTKIAPGILNRNFTSTGFDGALGKYSNWIVNSTANDVAMTVLPNAPIDPSTGLPVPTIAVATNGGVSVIKDDGSVVDITAQAGAGYNPVSGIDITEDYHLIFEQDTDGRAFFCIPIPSADRITATNDGSIIDKVIMKFYANGAHVPYPCFLGSGIEYGISLGEGDNQALVSTTGDLTILHPDFNAPANGKVAYIASDYNTGWMHGDIKGAFLSDTDATNVTGTELHPNGNSDFSSTDVSYISNSASGTATVVSGQLQLSGGTSNYSDHIITIDNLEIGSQYIITIDYISKSAGAGNIGFYVNGFYLPEVNDGIGYIGRDTGKSYSFYFTTEFSSRTIDLVTGGSTSETHTFDNWSIKKVEEDRSVNNKGLQVFGTITTSAVATGADLVGYSGFSGSNVLVQPYNSSLDPGTGDYSFICWFKCSSTGAEQMLMRRFGVPTVTGGMMMRLVATSSVLQWYVRDTSSNATTVQSPSAVDDGNWHCAVGTRQGSTAQLYLDGVLVTTQTCSANSHDPGTTANLVIGAEESGANPGTYQNPADLSSLALVRYSLSAPTPEQIKKIYEDEKVLFQENAKCTLYGSSDAVTALAYDDDNQLLHVGTSSGRSDFQGLRRINNTTTAVTTAISASNGLIAEQ